MISSEVTISFLQTMHRRWCFKRPNWFSNQESWMMVKNKRTTTWSHWTNRRIQNHQIPLIIHITKRDSSTDLMNNGKIEILLNLNCNHVKTNCSKLIVKKKLSTLLNHQILNRKYTLWIKIIFHQSESLHLTIIINFK